MDPQASSLDRFLRNGAHDFLGSTWGGNSSALAGGIWGGLLGGGLAFLFASVTVGSPDVGAAVSGGIAAGMVSLGVVGAMRKRLARFEKPTVKLSDEARRFLFRAMRQAFGARYTWIVHEPRMKERIQERRRALFSARIDEWEQRPAESFLHPDVFALLDAAAKDYNRIQGELTLAEAEPGVTLKKMKPAIMQAANETMADLLHEASMMETYPERGGSAGRVSERHLAALRETADRVEALHASEPDVPEGLAATRTMDSVLEDLRMEQIARAELQAPD